MSGVDLGEGFDSRLVEIEIGRPAAGVHVDEYLFISHDSQKLGRCFEVGLLIGHVFGEEATRTPQARLIASVHDVAVAAVRCVGAPLAPEKGNETSLLIGGG